MTLRAVLRSSFALTILLLFSQAIVAQNAVTLAAEDKLLKLQQQFVDLKFGMFIHFNIPTFMADDWADPEASPEIFNPRKLNCLQWADVARSANMSYGCLTTKHHSGFCIWDTKTTSYNVMNSPLKRDVVKEYTDAFRKRGLKVMLYYSILDTHHKLRPGFITRTHIEMIKAQLTELLTNYGEVSALIIDGWDAPWSRISYDTVPFEEIYTLVKSLQPDCLLMDLNAAKYPAEALFYTDIKSYEQGAGQHISKETNELPALSCLPLQKNWFWKENFPANPVKDPTRLVKDNLEPLNKVHCNFILNVAPNRDGLIDDNAKAALESIGKIWKNTGPTPPLKPARSPIISSNIAKGKPSNSSWSDDMNIMDFANDDDFTTAWMSNPSVRQPWYQIDFNKVEQFDAVVITQMKSGPGRFTIEYDENGKWKTALTVQSSDRVVINRFKPVFATKVKITFADFATSPAIAEVGVYNEHGPH